MKIRQKLTRLPFVAISLMFVPLGVIGGISQVAHAFPSYGELQSRSVEMSTSVAGASATYHVSFTAATTASIGGIVVDFCSNDPIMGDTCTAPTGLSIGTPTVSGASSTLTGTWTAGKVASSVSTLSYTTTTPVALTGGSSQVYFDITSMTNPSTASQLYARLYTFDTATDAGNYSATGTDTGLIDAGGTALYTTNALHVTSKVQEELTFCIDTNSASNCGGASGNAVSLGDSHGVLSSNGPFVDKTTQYIVQTNAGSGAVIRLEGNTLTSGSNSIAAACTGTCPGATPTTSVPGTSQFGLCTYDSAGAATITAASTYNGGAAGLCQGTTQTSGTGTTGGDNGASFGLNTALTSGTYGDTLASVVAGAQATGTLVFLGNISVTQPAGIYSTTLTFIATGTY
jgi:hypothetical protein